MKKFGVSALGNSISEIGTDITGISAIEGAKAAALHLGAGSLFPTTMSPFALNTGLSGVIDFKYFEPYPNIIYSFGNSWKPIIRTECRYVSDS
jgi:hypothetical protein